MVTRSSRHPNRLSGPDPGRALPVCLRELESTADYAACARLQRQVWGEGYQDIVPGSMIKVSQKVGGVCAGAFTEVGELAGFVFGLTGPQQGRLIHWSHMLAVDERYRDRGVGRRLKLYQRSLLEPLGVEAIQWTFDPLVARNAHLNLNHLGASIVGYVADMYADTGSDLHSFGTDRLVASWPLNGFGDGGGSGAVPEDAAAWDGTVPGPGARAIRLAIPADAESMRDGSLAELREWRARTRAGFTALLADGWRVTGFRRSEADCHYVLERPTE